MHAILKRIFKIFLSTLAFTVLTYTAYASWQWWLEPVNNPADYERVLRER
jgi:TRAP-type C4-dicarboxylate transport system permease small subunit